MQALHYVTVQVKVTNAEAKTHNSTCMGINIHTWEKGAGASELSSGFRTDTVGCLVQACAETGAHTRARKLRVNKQGSVFNHPVFVYLAVVRFSHRNLPNSTSKFLFLDSRENVQTVLIPPAGKWDSLFPEQSITSEYKNKYEVRARASPQSEEGKNLPGSLTGLCVFPLFHQQLGHFCAVAHYLHCSYSLSDIVLLFVNIFTES